MNKERVYLEINDENATYDGNTLKVTISADKQSEVGVDLYFNTDFIKGKNLNVTSVSLSPAPLLCFWQWLLSTTGSPNYEETLTNSIDISKYQNQGISGGFGFSGYTPDNSGITLTFKIAE